MSQRSGTQHGYGTGLYCYASYDTPGSGPDSFAANCNPVAELRSAVYDGGQFGKVDITHLLSPAGFKEYLPSFAEGGQFQFAFNYTEDLWQLLDGLTPDITSDTGPGYGRRRIDIADPNGALLTARVMFQVPTKETTREGEQMINVTCEVMEGRVEFTAS